MAKKSNKSTYTEISKAQITDTRNIVISDCSAGGFTIAQRMDVKEGKHTNQVYMKGAFHIDDVHGLYELRDAINLAIQIGETNNLEDGTWDE